MAAGGWADLNSVARYAHVMPGEAALAADHRLPQLGQNPGTIPGNASDRTHSPHLGKGEVEGSNPSVGTSLFNRLRRTCA